MLYKPAVFAVEDSYQILVPVESPSLMWVQVGDVCYYDDSNGILRSSTDVHRMTVPMHVLDAAGSYTICERKIPQRKPYFSQPGPVVQITFSFRSVPRTGAIRAYLLSDTHDRVAEPIRAARAFGDVDFLIFNGDIADHSDEKAMVLRVFEIADQIAGGEIPMVFSRGNHDTRGVFAEKYVDYTPHADGRSYYTFRLGRIWGIVMDCGEDKDDDHEEYGGTICCHDFRQRETSFLEEVACGGSFCAPEIETRIVIVHNPFTHQLKPPFNIEQEIYSHWAQVLKTQIRPDVMLTGHLHDLRVSAPDSDFDDLGQPCTVVVGCENGAQYFAGSGLTFLPDGVEVAFTDSDGKRLDTHFIPKNPGSAD